MATLIDDDAEINTSPAVTPTGNLEITVSRAELLRELTAAQSVVERKTTIPILSNFLFEATTMREGGRAADDYGDRSRPVAEDELPGAA